MTGRHHAAFLTLAIVVVAGCVGVARDDEQDNLVGDAVAAAEVRDQDQASRLDALSTRAADFNTGVSSVEHELRAADGEFHNATRAFESAVQQGEGSAAGLVQATRDLETARTRYREVATVLIVMAASGDAGNALRGGQRTTAAFRWELRAKGVELQGLDVDHIWPHAMGGADHPWNYQLLEASVNRSLGASLGEKFARWPLATLQGMVVSAVATLACR